MDGASIGSEKRGTAGEESRSGEKLEASLLRLFTLLLILTRPKGGLACEIAASQAMRGRRGTSRLQNLACWWQMAPLMWRWRFLISPPRHAQRPRVTCFRTGSGPSFMTDQPPTAIITHPFLPIDDTQCRQQTSLPRWMRSRRLRALARRARRDP